MIKLYKTNVNGSTQMWEAFCKGNTLTVRWGQVDCKIQEKVTVYKEGKNKGRANETTPEQQAISEMNSTAKKKRDKGYSEKIGETSRTVPLPMLAKVLDDKTKLTKTVFVQPKLDGIRCLADPKTGKLFTRNGKRLIGLEHIEEAVKNLRSQLWLDGELYTHGMTFQELASAIKRVKSVSEKAKDVKYILFDCVDSKSKYLDRLMYLRSITKGDYLEIVGCRTVNGTRDEINKAHAEFIEEGYEGTMVRLNDDTAYEIARRSKTLLKKKDFMDEEFTVVGTKAEENRDDILGSFILEMADGRTFDGRPACTMEERKKIWKNRKDYVGQRVTVKFQGWGDPDKDGNLGLPRFPVVLGIREIDQ